MTENLVLPPDEPAALSPCAKSFFPLPRTNVEVCGYDADLQLAGHRIVRITHRQVAGEPFALVARMASALARTPVYAIRPPPGPLVN